MFKTKQADSEVHEDQLLNFLVNTLNDEIDLDLGANAELDAEDIYEVLVGAARHPSCNTQDSASFAHGPVSTTCSMARNTGRSLASHAYFTSSRDSSVSIESARQ